MDLSTSYMGLALRNPLVASRVAAVEHARRHPAAGRRRRRRGRALLAVRGAAAPGGGAERAAGRRRHRELRRVAVLLPCRGGRGRQTGPRRYLSLLERAAAAVEIPVIASLNGVTPRRLDRLRPGDAGRGCRGDRAEHLLRARRPAHLRPGGRAAAHRHPVPGQGRGDRAGGGQAEPALQLDRRDGAAAGRGRRGRPGAFQPVPAARHRPGDPRGGTRREPVQPGRGPAAAHLDLDPARTGYAPRSRRPPASRDLPTWSSTCWQARTS